MSKELLAMFEGQDLSQEFKDKLVAIFESTVEEKETELRESIETKYSTLAEDYAQYVVAETEAKAEQYINEEVLPSVDKYASYAVSEFMKENKLAVESGIKVELAEQFLGGLTGLAEQFNVKVPEGRDDYITEMEAKFEKLQSRFDAILSEKALVEQDLKEHKMGQIVDSVVVDLTESQKEKFFKVAAKVNFEDEAQYKAAVDSLFESYFPVEGDKQSLTEKTEEKTSVNESKQDSYLDLIFKGL